MKKHRSRAGLARGRTIDARRKAVAIAPGIVLPGKIYPNILVQVKRDKSSWKHFKMTCNALGLQWKVPVKAAPMTDRWTVDGVKETPAPVQDKPVNGIVEVHGPELGLRELRSMWFVTMWWNCLDVGEPRFYYRR